MPHQTGCDGRLVSANVASNLPHVNRRGKKRAFDHEPSLFEAIPGSSANVAVPDATLGQLYSQDQMLVSNVANESA
jgi:hypothetical protein